MFSFFAGLLALLLAEFTSARGLRLLSRAGRNRDIADHLTKFAQALFDVLSLIAVPIATENNLAITRELGCEGTEKAHPWAERKGRACSDVPAEDGFAVYLIDVLAARTGTARKGKLEFLERDLNFWSGFQFDDQHGMISLWVQIVTMAKIHV